MSFYRPVTLAINGGSSFDHYNFFNGVLSFLLRGYFSLIVYVLAKLASLDESLDLLFELPTIVSFMFVVPMVLIVLGRISLVSGAIIFLGFGSCP